ncbi:unnamed protein product [Gadus morhua 'NCC']
MDDHESTNDLNNMADHESTNDLNNMADHYSINDFNNMADHYSINDLNNMADHERINKLNNTSWIGFIAPFSTLIVPFCPSVALLVPLQSPSVHLVLLVP